MILAAILLLIAIISGIVAVKTDVSTYYWAALTLAILGLAVLMMG